MMNLHQVLLQQIAGSMLIAGLIQAPAPAPPLSKQHELMNPAAAHYGQLRYTLHTPQGVVARTESLGQSAIRSMDGSTRLLLTDTAGNFQLAVNASGTLMPGRTFHYTPAADTALSGRFRYAYQGQTYDFSMCRGSALVYLADPQQLHLVLCFAVDFNTPDGYVTLAGSATLYQYPSVY